MTTTLDLSRRGLTDDDMAGLEIGPDIDLVDLSHNRIGNAGVKILIAKLKNAKQRRLEVDLSYNEVGDVGFVDAAAFSRVGLDFNMSYNKLTLEGYKRYLVEHNNGWYRGVIDETGNPYRVENSIPKILWVTLATDFSRMFGCRATQHMD